MSTTRTVLNRKDTAKPGDLYLSFELGDKSWKLTIGDGGGAVSRYTVAAGDKSGVADCIVRAGNRFKTSARAQVHSCYEADRNANVDAWIVSDSVACWFGATGFSRRFRISRRV